MRFLACFGSLLALVGVSSAFAAQVTINEDRMAVVDGKRTFILGLYENPADDAVLKQVAEAGFNLVNVPMDKAAIDRLGANGLGAWINTGRAIDLSAAREQREQALKDMAAQFAGHPALLAWEVPDEALWNCWYSAQTWRLWEEPSQQSAAIAALQDAALAEKLKALLAKANEHRGRNEFAQMEAIADAIWKELGKEQPNPGLNMSNAPERAATMCAGMLDGYRLLKQIDPNHPVWMNHAPRNSIEQLARFDQAADAVGCDIYPVPPYRGGHSDLADRSLTSVGAYTQRMQEAAPGKPVWMVLQGFAWADINKMSDEDKKINRRPTFEESRLMAYDTIVRGARGILYWGTAYIEKDSDLWKHLMKLVRELADLQPVLSAPDAKLAITVALQESWGSIDGRVLVLPKQAEDGVWFIVVNEYSDPLTYTLQGLTGLDGVKYQDRTTDCGGAVAGDSLTLTVPGHGVHVLAPQKP